MVSSWLSDRPRSIPRALEPVATGERPLTIGELPGISSDASYEKFAREILPLHNGPHVKIELNPSARAYYVPKDFLCRQSDYFAGMFEGRFTEGRKQSAVLTEMRGVVSARSVEMLLQWLYSHRVQFKETDNPFNRISATIEFARFADMCGVQGMEVEMANLIHEIIETHPLPPNLMYDDWYDPNSNTQCLIPEHVDWASLLPEGHAVRVYMAQASVDGYLRCPNDYKFKKETQMFPRFGADLLQEVQKALEDVYFSDGWLFFVDPITKLRLRFQRCPVVSARSMESF